MTKRIPLTQGLYAIVDDDDYDLLTSHKWWLVYSLTNDRLNAATYIGGHQVYMHRFILGVTDPKILVDHINRDTLDNQRSNLRTATAKESSENRGLRSDNKTGARGVWYEAAIGKYRAAVTHKGKLIHLGSYNTLEEAAAAALAGRMKYHTRSDGR